MVNRAVSVSDYRLKILDELLKHFTEDLKLNVAV